MEDADLTIRAEGDRFVLTGTGTADRSLLGEAVAALARAVGERLAVESSLHRVPGELVVRPAASIRPSPVARGDAGPAPAPPPHPVPV